MKMQLSPEKSFQIPDISSTDETSISLVQGMRNYDKINIQVRVLKVLPPTRVPSGKEQDLVVAGCVKLTVWQEEVGNLKLTTATRMIK